MVGLRKWQLPILSFSWVLTYPPGNRSIKLQAQTNFVKCINETRKSLDTQHISHLASRASHIEGRSSSPPPPPLLSSHYSRSSEPECNSTNEQQSGVDLEGLIQSGNFTLKVVGLRKDSNVQVNSLFTLDLRLKANVTLIEIMVVPMFSLHVWGRWSIPNLPVWRTWNTYLSDRRRFSLTQRFHEASKLTSKRTFGEKFCSTITYEEKCRSEPLLWWWNKYTAHHGLTLATTPSQTIAKLQHNAI